MRPASQHRATHRAACHPPAAPQIFATLVLLNKSRGEIDIRLVMLRVLLEFLQFFRVVFNTTFPAWSIDTRVWAFKAIRWVLIRWAGAQAPRLPGRRSWCVPPCLPRMAARLRAWPPLPAHPSRCPCRAQGAGQGQGAGSRARSMRGAPCSCGHGGSRSCPGAGPARPSCTPLAYAPAPTPTPTPLRLQGYDTYIKVLRGGHAPAGARASRPAMARAAAMLRRSATRGPCGSC
jgi:hypothetical protein